MDHTQTTKNAAEMFQLFNDQVVYLTAHNFLKMFTFKKYTSFRLNDVAIALYLLTSFKS